METTPTAENQAKPTPSLADFFAAASAPPPPDPLDVLREAYAQLDAFHTTMKATLDRYLAKASGEHTLRQPVYFAPPKTASVAGRPAAWSGMVRQAGGVCAQNWSGLSDLGMRINPRHPVALQSLSNRLRQVTPDSKGQCQFSYPGVDGDGNARRFEVVATRDPEGLDFDNVRWENYDKTDE